MSSSKSLCQSPLSTGSGGGCAQLQQGPLGCLWRQTHPAGGAPCLAGRGAGLVGSSLMLRGDLIPCKWDISYQATMRSMCAPCARPVRAGKAEVLRAACSCAAVCGQLCTSASTQMKPLVPAAPQELEGLQALHVQHRQCLDVGPFLPLLELLGVCRR